MRKQPTEAILGAALPVLSLQQRPALSTRSLSRFITRPMCDVASPARAGAATDTRLPRTAGCGRSRQTPKIIGVAAHGGG